MGFLDPFPGIENIKLKAGLLTYNFISPSHHFQTVAKERDKIPQREIAYSCEYSFGFSPNSLFIPN